MARSVRFSLALFVASFLPALIPIRVEAGSLERVPTDHATITAAIAAVDPGGTVLIEDSGIYQESVIIQKANVSLEAAPGESPTIRYDGANSYVIYADQPCQIGSNTGGRIIVDGNRGGPGSQTHVFRTPHTNGEVRLENLDVTNLRNNQVIYPDGTSSDITLNNVDIDGGGILQFAIRVDFLNSVLTLNCVNLTNCVRECLFSSNPATGIININNSILSAGFDVVFFDYAAGGFTLNIDNSLIEETGGGGGFSAFYTRGAMTINMTRSTIRVADIDAFAFYHFDDQAGTGPVIANFDHCDFVADFPIRLLSSFSANSYTVTNCNFRYGATSSGRGQLLGGPAGGDDTVVWDNNNVVSGSYGTFPVGGNDISIDPIYADVANRNFSYSNATVLVSDDSGGPIGSNQSYPTGTCATDLVIHVPSDYASIQDAIDAVAPYGTIRIEDSGIYSETLSIQKPGIVIEAAPCESPTLRYDGSNSYMIYCSEPFQFGSNSGGRIRLNENQGGAGSLTHVFRPQHSYGLVTFENLALVNMRNTYVYFPDPGSGDVYMNNVDADGLNQTLGIPVPQFILRIDFLSSIFTMNHCNFRNMGRDSLFTVSPNSGTVNIWNSVIQSTFDTMFFDFAAGGYTINIDNSYIHESGLGGGGFSTIYSRGANTFNITNSVIRCDEVDGFGFYMFDDQALAGPTTAVIDHCDFIADFPVRLLSSANANNLSITNCNFRYGATSSGRGQLLGGTDLVDDIVTWNYNNVVSNSYGSFPVGANDIQIDPLYNDTTISPPLLTDSDFRINDATVLISDDAAGPLGTNANFNAEVNIPTVSLDFTEGSGYEVDVVVPDFLPAAQPKSQPIQVFSQNVGNVVVTALNLVGPDAVEWGVMPVAPVVVNKSCPACIKVTFDPTVIEPTAGLMSTLEIQTNDAVTGLLSVDLVGDAVGNIPGASNDNWNLYE